MLIESQFVSHLQLVSVRCRYHIAVFDMDGNIKLKECGFCGHMVLIVLSRQFNPSIHYNV